MSPGRAAADTPPPPAIDLSNPAAAVSDPLAAVAYLDTECHAGQVDLNAASEADISAAFDLPSSPTVDRLIAMRPWLKGADLSSVPGISPQMAAAIAPQACATQPALPAPRRWRAHPPPRLTCRWPQRQRSPLLSVCR